MMSPFYRLLFLSLLFCLLLIACGPSPGHKALIRRLDNGVGSMTYAEAVKHFGPTPYVTKDDRFIRAIWIENYGDDFIEIETPEGPKALPPWRSVTEKTLIFDRDTELLRNYMVDYR